MRNGPEIGEGSPSAIAPGPAASRLDAAMDFVRGRAFFGWYVVLATFLIQLILFGISFYSFGVFLVPFEETFGVSRAAVALSFTLFGLVSGLLAPFIGGVMASRSIKGTMLVGSGLVVLGFVLLSMSTQLWHLYVCFGVIIAAGSLLSGLMPCSALLVNWFERRRGFALGLSQIGASVSGVVFVPLASMLVEQYGWRVAILVFAVLAAVTLPALILFLVVDKPEKLGERPDGDPPKAAPAGRTGQTESGTQSILGYAMAIVRDPRIWILSAFIGLATSPIGGVIQTLHSYVTDLGHSPGLAATLVAAMTLLSACAKPVFGALADRIGITAISLGAIILQGLALVSIVVATHPAVLGLSSAAYGMGYGAFAPLLVLWIGLLFGRDEFARVMGVMVLLLLPFNLIGFPFAAWVQDSYGSYSGAYLAFLGLYVLAAMLLWPLARARRAE